MKIHILILLMASSMVTMAEETMYIQSTTAKLFRNQSFSSQVIFDIQKGESVQVIETSGRWAKIHYQKHHGWTPMLLLSKNPPLNKISVLSDDQKLGDNARRRASAVATAGATRGLTADNRQRANESTNINYRALMFVEQEHVSESELTQFAKEMTQ